jgi:hypothetical protein
MLTDCTIASEIYGKHNVCGLARFCTGFVQSANKKIELWHLLNNKNNIIHSHTNSHFTSRLFLSRNSALHCPHGLIRQVSLSLPWPGQEAAAQIIGSHPSTLLTPAGHTVNEYSNFMNKNA